MGQSGGPSDELQPDNKAKWIPSNPMERENDSPTNKRFTTTSGVHKEEKLIVER